MASHPLQDFIRRLRRARSVTEGGHLTDAQLLERFARQRDEAAFEVLVWRHGTMVLNVARRLLRQAADAEDVFQATFLTLARKAAAIRRGTSVGSWLYKVAYRLALRARQTAARHQRQEQSGLENVAAEVEAGDAELSAVLAEEVGKLPERCRAVVVLCYLQGATTEEAARLLGCPRGTVLSRLASARQRLRQRLIRRGIAPAVALAAVSFSETASVGPSTALAASAVRAALSFAAGGAVVPIVSPQAAALAKGALQTMMWNKIKIVTVMACMIALVGTGTSWLTRGRSAVEIPLPAAEPPVKKGEADKKTSDPREQALRRIAIELETIEQKIRHLDALEEEWEENMSKFLIKARVDLDDRRDSLSAFRGDNQIEIRNRRTDVYRAEHALHRIEAQQARKREEFTMRRRALFARLQKLEDMALDLELKSR